MAFPKTINIVENISGLKKMQKAAIPMIANRIKALIEFKKNEKTGISKRAVADNIGVNHNSVQTWRKLYEQGCTYRTMLTPSFRFYLDPPIPDQVDPLVT